jgi:TatA/E family protein of Tat protein translocase
MWENLLRPTHLLVILTLALLFFGPKRFPQFGKALGDGWRGLRSMFQSKEGSAEDPENEHGGSVRHIKGLLRNSNETERKN